MTDKPRPVVLDAEVVEVGVLQLETLPPPRVFHVATYPVRINGVETWWQRAIQWDDEVAAYNGALSDTDRIGPNDLIQVHRIRAGVFPEKKP